MNEIIENLSKNSKPYIHQIGDLDDLNKVYALLNHTSDMQENNFYPMIDGENCSSVESLFKEFAINFKFPDYKIAFIRGVWHASL